MLRRILLNHSSLYFIAIPVIGFVIVFLSVPELNVPLTPRPAILQLTFLNSWAVERFPLALLWFFPVVLITLFLPMLSSRFTMFEQGMFLNSILWLVLFPSVVYFSGDLQVLISSVIAMPAYYFIFGMYKSEYPAHLMFNAALIISAASLFYLPALIFIPLLWMAWAFYNPFKPRAYILSMIGTVLPYFFVFSFLFIFDQAEIFRINYSFRFLTGIVNHAEFLIFMAGLVFMVLLGLIRLAAPDSLKKVGLRKNMNYLLLAFVFFAGAMFLLGEYSLLAFVIFPASVICNFFFARTGRSWIFFFMFLLFCGFMLYFPFSRYLFN
jgi:hypothetical protein